MAKQPLTRKPFTKGAQLKLIETIQNLLDDETPLELIAQAVGIPLTALIEYAKVYADRQLEDKDEYERCDVLFTPKVGGETTDTPHVTLLTRDNGYELPDPSTLSHPELESPAHKQLRQLQAKETTMTSPITASEFVQAEESTDTVRFCDLFQTKVNYGEQSLYLGYTDYMAAIENVSTSQIEVNETRVKSIMTSIIKKGQLIQAPKVLKIEGEDTLYIGGGRHRGLAIERIVNEYVLSNADKVVTFEKAGEDYREIFFTVKCQLVVVPDRQTLIDFIITDNGSRSVSAFENTIANVDAGSASPLENVKLSLGRALFDAVSPILPTVTPNTCFSISGSILSKVGPSKSYATAEQVEELADDFALYVQENRAAIPSNFARDFKAVVDAFLTQEVVYEDKDGDEVDGTYVESWASRLVKPVKSSTKAKKTSKKQAEMMAALQAEMAASMGLTLEELQEAITAKRLKVA